VIPFVQAGSFTSVSQLFDLYCSNLQLLSRLLKEVFEVDYQLYGTPGQHHVVPSNGGAEAWQSAADTAAARSLIVGPIQKCKRKSPNSAALFDAPMQP